MIGYVFLTLGSLGTAAVGYTVAPAGRGLHRYVVPRSVLRAEAAQEAATAEELAGKLCGLASEYEGVAAERDVLLALLGRAERLIADKEEQLLAFDALCAENTQLRADLDNARAMRQLLSGPSPADEASALPDDLQDFADMTVGAWRATA